MEDAQVYYGRIVDTVDWSPAGWCRVFVRLPEIGVPFGMDVACVTGAPEEVFPVGSDLAFTLRFHTRQVERVGGGARIEHGWAMGLQDKTEPPLVPAQFYRLVGKVLSGDAIGLTLDCGLVVRVLPTSAANLCGLMPGDYVAVTGELTFLPVS